MAQTTIERTSIVTVKDSEATDGYILSAKLSATNIVPDGTVVTISSSTSTDCPVATPCTLTATPKTIKTTTTNQATTQDGETTTFQVKITLPANTAVGNYILDMEYDEVAQDPPSLPDTGDISQV